MRRRLRSRLVDQQQSKRNLFRKLVRRGLARRQAANAVSSNQSHWQQRLPRTCGYRAQSSTLPYIAPATSIRRHGYPWGWATDTDPQRFLSLPWLGMDPLRQGHGDRAEYR